MVAVLFLPERMFPDQLIFGMPAATLVSGISNGVVIPIMNAMYA